MESSSSEHNGGAGQQFQPPLSAATARRRARSAELADRNREALRSSDRARFWFAVKTAAICVVGCLGGLFPMAWALHTTDVESARIAWKLGPTIGTTLVLCTLIVAGIKWERDDW
jgi:hypothetical protein